MSESDPIQALQKLASGGPVARSSIAMYRQAIRQRIHPDQVADVLEMLYHQAVNLKDMKCARLFLEYTLGRPVEMPNEEMSRRETIDITKFLFHQESSTPPANGTSPEIITVTESSELPSPVPSVE